MIGIRKFIRKRIRWPVAGIVLVVALVMVLGSAAAIAGNGDPRPCPDPADPPASDAVNGTIVNKFAADMGNDTTPADLNTWNPQPLPGDSGGVLWDYFPSDQASGTGVFNTYLAVQAPGNDPLHEKGYNTALKPAKCSDYDEGDSKTSALLLSAVPTVTINGTQYREFACDINEVSGIPDQYVSLEVLQIWQSNSSNLCGTYSMSPDYKFTPVQRLVYDLDCADDYTLVLDYGVNTGSGKPDYKVFIPNSWFDQTWTYVVMVVDHGNLEFSTTPASKKDPPSPWLGFGCSDGFEEWGVRVVAGCCVDFVLPANNGTTVECPDDTDVVPTPPTMYDDCGGAMIPSGPVDSGKPVCEGTRTYTWTYVCDIYTHNWTYTYTVEYEDFTVPANNGTTVECPDDTDAVPTPPEVEDNCGNNITPTGPVDSGKPACEGNRTYIWTYTDCEGNAHNWTYTYTVDDNTPPEITCPPDFYGRGEGCSLDPETTGSANATDNCGGNVTITWEDDIVTDGCPWTVIRTWTATDCAGNNATCNQTIACCCEDTIWAYGGSAAIAVNTLVRSAEWGWTNLITPGTYVWDLYAGAGQNILSKGTIVGTVTVTYSGSCVTVTYNMTDANILTEAHLWVGKTALPTKMGRPLASPGQFPYRPVIAADGLSATWSGCSAIFSGSIYVAAHGVTLWCEPQV